MSGTLALRARARRHAPAMFQGGVKAQTATDLKRLRFDVQFVDYFAVPTRHPSSSASVAPASLAPDQQLFITESEPTSTNLTSGMATHAWRMACREPWLLNLLRVSVRVRFRVSG